MNAPILSFLDQSPAVDGMTHAETIRDTVAFASHCERLGFHRYWLAEHHSSKANVGSAPEILCAAIAMTTRRIRIGSAGVLLSHYAPLKIAEQFRVLESLAPGRIDLGIGRSPGGNPEAARALMSRDPAGFEDAVAELLGWLDDRPPPRHADVRACPMTESAPLPWILSSSPRGAALAARLGLPYCFNVSHGENHGLADEAVALYRRAFQPGRWLEKPWVALSVWALAADSAEEALFLHGPRARWRIDLDRGVRSGLVSAEAAARLPCTEAEKARIAQALGYSFVGDADDVAERLLALCDRHAADEIVMTCWTHDPADRLRCCALIASRLSRPSG